MTVANDTSREKFFTARNFMQEYLGVRGVLREQSARVATKLVRGDFDFSKIVLYCNGIAI